MSLPAELANSVRKRDADRCRYCLMHQSLQGATFHVEHIIPRCKGGHSEMSNLALACPSCNLHKADTIMAVDPVSGKSVRLFHPMSQSWSEHFRFAGHRIEGRTPAGRATVEALQFNHPRRQRIRVAEERLGIYPRIP
jgi:hypothetical protein